MMTRWLLVVVLIAPAPSLQKPPDTPPAAQQQLPTAPSAQKFPQPQTAPQPPNAPRVLNRDAFTFTRYELALNLANPPGIFSAEGKVWLRNDSHEAQRHAVLQISSTLYWESIKLGGKPAEYIVQEYTTDIDHTGAVNEAILNLPQPAAPGSTLEIEVRYHGTIPQNSTRLERIGAPRETALRTDWDEVTATSAFVRGIGYVVWYPVAMEAVSISEPDYERSLGEWKQRHASSTMKLSVAYPANQQFVSDTGGGSIGAGVAATSSVDAHTFRYSTLAFATANYRITSRLLGEVPGARSGQVNFQVFSFPGDANAANAYITAATQVEPLTRDWFGPLTRSATIAELPSPDDTPFECGSKLCA